MGQTTADAFGDTTGAYPLLHPRADVPRTWAGTATPSPLVVDLDGTLLSSDMLLECILAFVRRHPLGVFRILLWLLRGRACLKQELARAVELNTAMLPLNPVLAAYVASEKARGRRVYLATATDLSLAQPIAERCWFFDGVLASDGPSLLLGTAMLVAFLLAWLGAFA